MKKFLFFAVAFLVAGTRPHAQEWENSTPDYKYAVIWSSNGFYTLDEENRLMDEAIDAQKRKRERENDRSALEIQNEYIVENRRSDANPYYKYPGYYTPTAWGSNGFVSVDDADRSMYEAIAAEKRERAREEGTTAAWGAQKQDEKIAANTGKRSRAF